MRELKETEQKYDFRNNIDMAEEIAVKLESMNPKELDKMKKEMGRILAESAEEQTQESENWFNQAVIPILKDFAKQSESCLDLAKDGDKEITATIRKRGGFDITADDHRMKMLLLLAGHISIEECMDDLVIVLAFDLEYFYR